MTLTIRLPKLHKLQSDVTNHPARFKVLACGRRVGKSELGKDLLINAALPTGQPYAYFAPTYRGVIEMWDRIKAAAHDAIHKLNVQNKRITFLGGGSIDFWSLDAIDGTRGHAYAGAVVDEAAQVGNLEYAWNEVIRPTLTDYKGWALFLSTPRGRDFFWQLYTRGQDPVNELWHSWQQPTSANPHIDAGEIELARDEMPERAFSQEYLAEFLEDGGAVFRNISACATLSPGIQPQPNHEYIFGVDWAKSHDFTVIAVFDRTTAQLVHIERFNQISWALQRGRLRTMYDLYKPRAIWAEENSIGGPNIEALQRDGLPVRPFTTTAATKPPLIESLALAFEREQLRIINDPVLVGELQAYTLERLPSGRYRYNAPSGMHDDCVIATALAWHGATNRIGGGNIRGRRNGND
jgi:hypothetical protein